MTIFWVRANVFILVIGTTSRYAGTECIVLDQLSRFWIFTRVLKFWHQFTQYFKWGIFSMPVHNRHNRVRFLKPEITSCYSYNLQGEGKKVSPFSRYCVGRCQNWRMLIFTAATEIRWWVGAAGARPTVVNIVLLKYCWWPLSKYRVGPFFLTWALVNGHSMNQRNMGLDLFTTFNFTWHLKERKYRYRLKLKWGITRGLQKQ